MFDVAWSELLLIGAVALIFIGPKELPGLLVNIGRWVRRARTLAAEFQGSLDQALREAEIDALKQKVNSAVMEAEQQMPTIEAPSFGMQMDLPVIPSPGQAPSALPAPPLEGEPAQEDSSRVVPPSFPDASSRS